MHPRLGTTSTAHVLANEPGATIVAAKVAVSELALDDDEWDAFAGHLDGVGVAELMWGEPTPHAGSRGGLTEFFPGRSVGPVPSARRPGDDAEQRSDWKLEPCLKPGL